MISINPIISSLIARSISDEIVVRKGLKSYTYNHIYNDSRKLATHNLLKKFYLNSISRN